MDTPPLEPPNTSESSSTHLRPQKGKRVHTLFSKPANNGGGEEGDVPLHITPSKISQPVNNGLLEEFILEALAFTSMKDRQEEVAEVHQKTFGWIFDDTTGDITTNPGSNFLHWLRDTDKLGGIYWINGKAGSGKSTLLRFIYDHKKTLQELGDWANPKSLTIVGFFFWTSGFLEQRSQAGLLRSLLHQLLEQHRNLTPITFPGIWKRYSRMTTKGRVNSPISWSLLDLMEGLKLSLQAAAEKTKICLFIDGLDEFEGDHGEIIALLRKIVHTGNGNIKVCLSSRPWPIFESAFGTIPHLKLQDLTLKDRQHYAVDKFNKDARMRRIIAKQPESGAAMIDEIVERADGVFLWVILVVRALLGDMRTDDTVQDINDRLNLFPTDLEDFFRHTLFNSQTETAKGEASRILQLIRAREIVCEFTGDHSASSLGLWELALADLNAENTDQALKTPVSQATNEQILSLCNGMKVNIEAHCAGLLQIHAKRSKSLRQSATFAGSDPDDQPYSFTESKVTYLHRTVRDWLIYSKSVWNTIVVFTTSQGYHPHADLIRSYILQFETPS